MQDSQFAGWPIRKSGIVNLRTDVRNALSEAIVNVVVILHLTAVPKLVWAEQKPSSFYRVVLRVQMHSNTA